MLTHQDAPSPSFPEAPLLSRAEEITRVREHLVGAIEQVGWRRTGDLSPAQRAKRVALLGALIRYAVAGRFPKNIAHVGRMAPTFVDDEGARCAMAHLINATGNGHIVEAVANTANHAYVRELAADPSLVEWLVDNGLSREEAARIQPSYCFTPARTCVCEPIFYHKDLVELIAGVVADSGEDFQVDEVFKTASGIAVGDLLPITFNSDFFGPGTRVFASYADGAQLHYEFLDGDTLLMAACQLAPEHPYSLELAVILDIMNGADCESTLAAIDRQWAVEECTESEDVGASSGQVGAGGGQTAGGGGHTGDDGGTSEAGCSFSALPAHEAGLLFALVMGLAIARSRRRAHLQASKRVGDRPPARP